MKKFLSMILVLVMIASLVAIPAMAVESQDLVYFNKLPYKTEDFGRFRNAFTSNPATANLSLSVNNVIGVNSDELPLYGDSALIGVHNVAGGESFVTTADVNNNASNAATAEIGIVADETSAGTGVNRIEKALKLAASTAGDVRGMSFGFIPNEVLSQVDGIYFQWEEKVVEAGETAVIIPQWIGEDGLVVDGGNVVEIEHTFVSEDFTNVTVELKNNAYVYNGGEEQAIEFDLTAAPEGAVGLKLLVEAYADTDGLERYFKFLEAGTVGGNVAAFYGNDATQDGLAYDSTATEVSIQFSKQISDDTIGNVKLYLNNVEVEGATYEWTAENSMLTVTTTEPLGTSNGYRFSSSLAETTTGEAIINDVRFITTLKANTTAVVAPNVFDLYDLNGNKLNTAAVVDGNDVAITVFLNEDEEAPKAVVPSFTYTGEETGFHPDFFYNLVIGEDDVFAAALRGVYPVINGATAIPVKDFVLFQGAHATRNASYNVSIEAAQVPENVTSEIAAGEDDLAEVGLLTPVTVTFSHGISAEGQEAVTITENGEAFDALVAEWSADGKELTLAPETMWTLGAEYVITVPEDASIFGERATVVADGLIFTATEEVPGEEFVDTFELTNESLIYTFDPASQSVAIIVKTEDEDIDLTAVEFNATITGVASFIEVDGEAVEAVDGVYTATLDISDALGASNAVTFAVDNGFNVDNEYSVYYVEATNPPTARVDFGTVETFENGTVGSRFTGTNIITSSGLGSYGAASHSAGTNENNARVYQDGDNKILRLTTSTHASNWVGLISVAVPQSFTQNASKLVFSYDVKQPGDATNGRAGVGTASTETSGVSGGQKTDASGISLFASSGWRTWFVSGSFTGRPDNSTVLKPTGTSSLYGDGTSWQTVEWILENAVVPAADDRIDSYEGTVGTTITTRAKDQGTDEWREGAPSEVAAWNFKDQEFIRFYITNDGKRDGSTFIGDYDNFQIYAISQDLATEVTLESGTDIAVGEKVDILFKTPLMPGQEGNFTFTDNEGNTVDYDYSWSEDRLTLSLIPDVEANKIYSLASENLKDVYNNDISVMAEVPVLPDEDYQEFADNAEYTFIEGDYSQTVNIFYRHDVAGVNKADFKFKAGSNSEWVREVAIPKPAAGVNYAVVSVVLPANTVESGETAVEIEIEAEIDLDILGVYFEEGMGVDEVNAVEDEEDALDVLEDLAAAMGKTEEFDELVESVQDDFVAALLDRLEEGEFETLDDAKEWFSDELETAIENNPDPDIDIDNDDEDEGGRKGTTGGSYAGGTSYVPTPEEVAVSTVKFIDLGQASWAKTAINTLYAAGIVKGVSENEYAPLNEVKREEFTKLIVELFGIYDPYLDSSFADVSSDAWYNGYIASAQKAGIVAGISETEFGVGQSITREQMATMLKRACDKYGVKLEGNSATTFRDENTISSYAADAVKTLAKAGIINGIDGSFAPQQVANRAMAAQVVYLVYLVK